jgi:Rieske Fe-S protein
MATAEQRGVTRRGLFAGAAAAGVGALGVGSLAGCGDTGGPPGVYGDPGPVTVPTSDVPVGGALVVGTVVVSQPVAGSFRAFSNICTHQTCVISRLNGDVLECACHGSRFSATDGAVLRGPANRPLDERDVTVEGDTITVS